MARPRIYNKPRVATAIRIPQDLHTELTLEARRRQVAVNLLVERAIESYLKNLPPLPEVE